MEAKDTVMSEKALTNDKYDGLTFDVDDIQRILEDQAEITWDKAIREVVDWHSEPCPHKNAPYFARDCALCSKSKLKEWGIEG